MTNTHMTKRQKRLTLLETSLKKKRKGDKKNHKQGRKTKKTENVDQKTNRSQKFRTVHAIIERSIYGY